MPNNPDESELERRMREIAESKPEKEPEKDTFTIPKKWLFRAGLAILTVYAGFKLLTLTIDTSNLFSRATSQPPVVEMTAAPAYLPTLAPLAPTAISLPTLTPTPNYPIPNFNSNYFINVRPVEWGNYVTYAGYIFDDLQDSNYYEILNPSFKKSDFIVNITGPLITQVSSLWLCPSKSSMIVNFSYGSGGSLYLFQSTPEQFKNLMVGLGISGLSGFGKKEQVSYLMNNLTLDMVVCLTNNLKRDILSNLPSNAKLSLNYYSYDQSDIQQFDFASSLQAYDLPSRMRYNYSINLSPIDYPNLQASLETCIFPGN